MSSFSLPSSKAVNISSEDNSVRTVVGGPLCDSGLPFGHSVITGDRHGHIALKNAVSGITRKQLATTYHGHHSGYNGHGGTCSGTLPTCGELSAVTVAEVILTGDDGSPTLWIGCSDGSVQVYFLGGSGGNNTRKQQGSNNRKGTPNNNAGENNNVNLLGDDLNQQHNDDHQHCSHCGSTTKTPPRKRSPPHNNNTNLHHHSGRSVVGNRSVTGNNTTSTNIASTSSIHKNTGKGFGGFTSPQNRSNNNFNTNGNGKSSSSSFLFTAADAATTISQDGCVLIFAEKKHSGSVQCFVNAPSIDSAFTGGADWSIVRWRTSYPFGVVAIIGRHSRSIRSLAFSPGQPSILLSGGDDGVIKLWSSRARKPTELAGHRGGVLAVLPWYDPVGLYGDVFSMLGSHHVGGERATIVSSAASPFGGINSNNSPSSSHQQQQKAIGLVSCGEDGTLRLWAADSQVANCVLQVSPNSKAPVVKAQIFSDNLIMAFTKDGAATVYNVTNFPQEASCIYRYDNVGQIHRLLSSSRRKSPVLMRGGKRVLSPTGRQGSLSSYLHDAKVLAHINGFLIWSLTSSGAKLSLLPLNHFESVTKKNLTTVNERREFLEMMIADTLDDTDSTQSGQLLFQKIIAGGGQQGENSALLQLAKLVEQQQAAAGKGEESNNTNRQNQQTPHDPHRAWNFDLPSEQDLDQFGDPGQLSTTEQTSSSLRALVKAVNTSLSEMARLNDDFQLLKTDWQMKSFATVMEMTKAKQADYLKREFDALEVRRKEILAAEQEMMRSNSIDSRRESTVAPSLSAHSKILPSKPKVNPRKQIGDMLQEMFTGKRTALTTATKSTALLTNSSSSSSTPAFEAKFTEIEKQLIEGISRSVTGEGAASYIYGYCLAKQQSVDLDFIKSQQEKKTTQAKEIAETNDKLETELEGLKKQLQTSKKSSHDSKEKVADLEKKLAELKSETAKKIADSQTEMEKKLKEANEKLADAEARAKQWKKELVEEQNRRPTELHFMEDDETASNNSKNTAGESPTKNKKDGEKEGDGAGADGDKNATSTGSSAPKLSKLSQLSLIVTTDKKFMKTKQKKAEEKAAAEASALSGSSSTSPSDADLKKKKKKDGQKSDEDEVETKKDVTGDQMVIQMPGVGSWKGAERRSIATQTKVLKSMSSAAQVELLINNSNSSASSGQQQQSTTDNNKKTASGKPSFFSDPNLISSMQFQKELEDQKKKQQLAHQEGSAYTPSRQIVEDTPVAGWTDQDLELIRESEDFLGKAAITVDDPFAALGSQQYNLSSKDGKTPNRDGEDYDNNGDASPEDENLADVGDTVTAALSQLRELEKMYEVSQRNLLAFEDAAAVEGFALTDPRIKNDLDKLRLEERALAEEMRRLHYLLTCPNSPLPPFMNDEDYYQNNSNNTNNDHQFSSDPVMKYLPKIHQDQQHQQQFGSSSLSSPHDSSFLNKSRSEYQGDRSLMKEFQHLIGKEKERMHDSMFLSNQVTSPESCVARGGGENSIMMSRQNNNNSSSARRTSGNHNNSLVTSPTSGGSRSNNYVRR